MVFKPGHNVLGGRPKGSKNKPDKFKDIVYDAIIKRKREVSSVKYDSLLKIGQGIAPREDTLKHVFTLPALTIQGLQRDSMPVIDITPERDALIHAPVKVDDEQGGGGSEEESPHSCNQPISDDLDQG